MAKKAVLLINLGGPDTLEAVEPFLKNLFSDRDILKLPFQKTMAKIISKLRAGKAKEKYRKIGGKSPLNEITKRQAEALEKELHPEYKVYIGMRYWYPSIEEALEEIKKEGIENLIILPLFPQYSETTTGSAIKETKRIIEKKCPNLKLTMIKIWHDQPDYLESLSERIK